MSADVKIYMMSICLVEVSSVGSEYALKVDELLILGLFHPLRACEACGYPAVGSNIRYLSHGDKACFFACFGLKLENSLKLAVNVGSLDIELYTVIALVGSIISVIAVEKNAQVSTCGLLQVYLVIV